MEGYATASGASEELDTEIMQESKHHLPLGVFMLASTCRLLSRQHALYEDSWLNIIKPLQLVVASCNALSA